MYKNIGAYKNLGTYKKPKKHKWSSSLSSTVSVFILTTSKLEAIQENHRCSLKLVQSGMPVGGGGGALRCTSFHLSGEQLQWVALGYARRVAPFHCPISVSFSFSTFLCFAASWTGVDRNIRSICAEQPTEEKSKFDPSILRHSGFWGAADEAVLNTVHRKKKKSPCSDSDKDFNLIFARSRGSVPQQRIRNTAFFLE